MKFEFFLSQILFQVLRKCHLETYPSGRIKVEKILSQKSLTRIKRILLFGVPMNPSIYCKAKLEIAHFFKVRSNRITVCPQSVAVTKENMREFSKKPDPWKLLFWSECETFYMI